MLTYLRKTIFLTGFVCTLALTLTLLSKERNELFENEEMEEQEERERETGADRQMEMMWQARAYPEHEFLNDRFMAAWQHAEAMRNPEQVSGAAGTSGGTDLNYGSWSQVGTNLNIGRVLSVAISPSNGNNLFLGSASGGIWKSTNGGTSWSAVRTGLPILGVPTITFHPTNANILLAGTGEVYRVDTSNIGFNVWKARGTYGVGLLRSTDGGVTWTQVLTKSYSNLFGVLMIRFDPNNANNVFACTTNGLFKSTDAGATWNPTPILNKIYVSDVVINSTNSNIMMAAVGNLVNADKGIYRTTDGGATWTKVVHAAIPTSFSGFSRFAYLSGNTVYVTMGRDDGGATQNELFQSTDFGASNWTSLANSHHCAYQFWFANTAAILPSNPNIIYMGGVNFYKYTVSTSTGTTVGSMHADFHEIKFDPSNSAIAYICNDGGIYKSTNMNNTTPTFTAINTGLNIAQFYGSVGVSALTANRFIGGLQDNGMWAYNGTTWSNPFGGDGGPAMIDPTNDNIVYASNDARTLRKSTSGITGAFSTVLNSWAFVGDDRTGFMAPIGISKTTPATLYVASDNLHKSTNSGGAWTNNNGTIANNTAYIEAKFKTGINLAVSPLTANKLYVSLSPFSQRVDNALNVVGNPTLFKSINGGTSFTNITTGLPNRFVMDMAISPTNDDSMMVVLGGYGTSHVYLTGNGGLTWVDRGTGLPDVPYNAIVFDKTNWNNVYVASDLGVYVSNNQGQRWFDFNGGLADATMVFDLQITADNRLLAATHGKGMFISNLATYGTLPANILDFSGVNRKSVNELKWTATAEKNIAYYELERKIDGGSYTAVTRLQPKYIDNAAYAFNDQIADNLSQGIFYYRLKMVNTDGTYTYSSVVVIRFYRSGKMEVLGNPVRSGSQLLLTVSTAQQVTLRLFDMQGKLLRSQQVGVNTGVNRLSLDHFISLPAGIYTLEVQTITEKLRKQIRF